MGSASEKVKGSFVEVGVGEETGSVGSPPELKSKGFSDVMVELVWFSRVCSSLSVTSDRFRSRSRVTFSGVILW